MSKHRRSPRHAAPRARAPFWAILGAGVAATALVTGTLGWVTSVAPVADVEAPKAAAAHVFHDHGPVWIGADGCGNYGMNEVTWRCNAPQGDQLDRREAALAIADRLDSGQPIFEDWTWMGMPELVGAYNDSLLDEWEAAGRPDPSGWLESYAATRFA